ncbi:MAG: AAA family ATPase [Candidatus Riflebacteria bacterium]|nr:AAA family ATPase [Candidatus Riflebacteria bacterium]
MENKIANYQITEKLYESSVSRIYRALMEGSRDSVILKILNKDQPTPEELSHFQNEFYLAKNNNNIGIINVLSLEKIQDTLMIVQEDIGGESLDKWMKARRMSLKESLSLAIQITESLKHLHEANIINKNLNPSNIIWNPKTEQLKLIDFGMATFLTEKSSASPQIPEGTLAYISPEQTGRMNRTVDYRTDFYSLGVTLFEIFTGRLPFETQDPLEIIYCHIARQPVPPSKISSNIPEVLSMIIMKLLAKTPEERYQTLFCLNKDLTGCQNQLRSNAKIEAFPIGQEDWTGKLQISKKLYGREAEIRALIETFERASGGSAELFLIAGNTGVGKTVLVQEVQKIISEKIVYFVSGKYEQYQNNIPYSAISIAFKTLVTQLLAQPEEQLQNRKKQLSEAVGSNGQIIIEIIPEAKLLLGEMPATQELEPTDSQKRFNSVFRNFIRVFCQPDHPLVIFLDDLQWADLASLKLMALMMKDIPYLFLIGSYRDSEVNAVHPLISTLEEIRKTGVDFQTITLPALTLTQIKEFLTDTFNLKPNEQERNKNGLAELLLAKTGGNPFFLKAFVRTLYSENLISFDYQRNQWQWNLVQIQACNITDNVVELMVGKILQLSPETGAILKLAAVMGNRFEFSVLAILAQQSEEKVSRDLLKALQDGLIVKTPDAYQFIHDRVHQAVYSLLSELEKQIMHWQIGQLLLRDPIIAEEKLFELVDHLNMGEKQAEDQPARNKIARFNLRAGQKAKAATAYHSSYKYLQTGHSLLSKDSWQNDYELALDLYTELTEVAFLNGDFKSMERFAEVVNQNAATILDKARIFEIRMQANAMLNKYLDGLLIGFEFLGLLGVNTPNEATPAILKECLNHTKKEVGKYSSSVLLELRAMTDPVKLAAMRVLIRLISLSYFARPDLFPIVVCQGVLLSVQYGNSIYSSAFYVNYGLILCDLGIADYASGSRYGKLGQELFEKYPNPPLQPMLLNNTHTFITPYCLPIRESLIPLKKAYQVGLKLGEYEFAAYASSNYLRLLSCTDTPLPEVHREYENYIEAIRPLNNELITNLLLCLDQTIINLMSDTSKIPWEIKGESYQEGAMGGLLKSGNPLGISMHYFNQLILAYLFGKTDLALQAIEHAEPYIYSIGSAHPVMQYCFYAPLALLAPLNSSSEFSQVLEKVRVWQNHLKRWAEHASMNFQHKHDLVEAEIARISGHFENAVKSYEKAIRGAHENGYQHEEALACEVAAKFYLTHGLTDLAQVYINKARYGYQRWGAQTKVRDLEIKYPNLFSNTVTHPTSDKPEGTPTCLTKATEIDLASIMKAAQTISGEMKLDNLLEKIMNIVIENAGAEKGVFIENNQYLLKIQAEAGIGKVFNILKATPIEKSENLPLSVIRYVARTNQHFLSDNISQDSEYSSDPYVRKNGPKSVICFPILSKGALTAVIYLENNLAVGAFTSKHLEVLNLLAAQAAISLENARLFEEKSRYSEELLKEKLFTETALNAQTDTFFVFEPSTQKAVRWNKAFRDISGYSDEEIKLMKAPDNYYNEKDLKSASVALEKIKAGESAYIQMSLISKSGKTIPTEYFESAIRDETGTPQFIIAVGRDISDRLKVEEQLRQAQKMDALGSFSGGIAHDFNNILAIIIANHELALNYDSDHPSLKQRLAESLKACLRAKELINQILIFSRKASPEKEPLNISKVIQESMKLLRPAIPSTVKIEQKIDVSENILANSTQINQIMLNLCSNACNAMENNGTLEIKLEKIYFGKDDSRLINRLAPGNYVKLSISDTGCGIKPEIMSRIFDPFFTTKECGKGTGLGLSVVYGIVEAHEGTITVYSEPGKGSTFNIYLPCIEVRPEKQIEPSRANLKGSERILFIDDEEMLLEISQEILQSLGYTVTCKISPTEAFVLFRSAPNDYDLIITDLTMPDLPGDQLAIEVLKIRPEIPIILCTGYGETVNGKAKKFTGINRILLKPVTKQSFAKTIREVLDEK